MENKIIGGLKDTPKDKRDFSYSKKFGSISPLELPKEFYVSQPLEIKNQFGSDFCVGFGTASVREDTELVILDPYFFWSQMAKIRGNWKEWGADLRLAAKTSTKIGIVKKQDQLNTLENKDRDFLANWENYPEELDEKAKEHIAMSYFWVDGSYDNFDNIRSTLYLNAKEKRSVLIGAEWHQEWSDSKNGIIDDVNMQSLFFGHAFKLYGWKEINNKPYLVAQLSNGKGFGDNGLFYFSRNVINSLAFRYGAITFRDFDPELYKKIEWTILQILANYIAILKKMIEGLIAKKQKPIKEIPMPPEPIKISRIKDWAEYITKFEGWK